MTQPSFDSPSCFSPEQDNSSPIKPLALHFAMLSPEVKEVPSLRRTRTLPETSVLSPPAGQGPFSPLSPGSDPLIAVSPTAVTHKMKISPSPPSQPPNSLSSPSSPIYPTAPLFNSHSSPTSPALAPLSLGGRVPLPELNPREALPGTSPKPKPVLTIVTQDDFSASHHPHIASLIGDDNPPETAPPSLSLLFGPSAPSSPRNLPPRPKSTTAADCLRAQFSFPELEDEHISDDEFINRRSQLQRSQSVSGRMEPDSGTPTDLDSQMGGGLLPSIDSGGSSCGIKRISIETCAALIRGEYRQAIDRFLVADCRYDYEYIGGHIIHAVNTNSKQTVESLFEQNKEGSGKVVVIFHCEFSKHRGPNCCRHFRQFDRESNTYPTLTFPELYVMEGGYRQFYQNFPELCVPNGYVSMWDPKYSKECKDRHKEFKKSWASKASKRGGRYVRETNRNPTGNSSRRSLSRGRRLEAIEDSGSPDGQASRDKGESGIYGRYQKTRKTDERHVLQPSSSPPTAFPTPSGSPRGTDKEGKNFDKESNQFDKENNPFASNQPERQTSISPQFASLRLRSKSSPAGPSFPFSFPKNSQLSDMDTDTFSLSEPMQLESVESGDSPTKQETSTRSETVTSGINWNFTGRSRH